jgi:hypothetical protein
MFLKTALRLFYIRQFYFSERLWRINYNCCLERRDVSFVVVLNAFAPLWFTGEGRLRRITCSDRELRHTLKC